MKYLFIVLAVVLVSTAQAATPKPLTVDNWPQLQADYQGQHHVLVFWSLRCVPCRDELKQLGQVVDVDDLPIVLINAGGQRQTKMARAFLHEAGLTGLDNRIFAAVIPARLRQTIDPNWYGALPRSVKVTAEGKRTIHLGKTDITGLVVWLRGK